MKLIQWITMLGICGLCNAQLVQNFSGDYSGDVQLNNEMPQSCKVSFSIQQSSRVLNLSSRRFTCDGVYAGFAYGGNYELVAKGEHLTVLSNGTPIGYINDTGIVLKTAPEGKSWRFRLQVNFTGFSYSDYFLPGGEHYVNGNVTNHSKNELWAQKEVSYEIMVGDSVEYSMRRYLTKTGKAKVSSFKMQGSVPHFSVMSGDGELYIYPTSYDDIGTHYLRIAAIADGGRVETLRVRMVVKPYTK